jgi:hypothetical protein
MAGQVTRAEANLYQSESNPFVRMMLTMMDAMGLVDKVPHNGMYGQYGSPLSGYSNPYSRALALRGMYPGASSLYNNPYSTNLYGNNLNSGYGVNPFTRSPWLSSPWLGSGEYGSPNASSLWASPIWGTPDWGVLPTPRSPYAYPLYDQSYWSTYDVDEWVDEPWDTSEWNPDAVKPEESVQAQQQALARQQLQSQRQQASQPNVPLVQNFNFTVPEDSQPRRSQNNSMNNRSNYGPGISGNSHSPLSKLAPTRHPPWQQAEQPGSQTGRPPPAQQNNMSPLGKKSMQQSWGQQPMTQATQSRQPSRSQPKNQPGQKHRNQLNQKPCITEFCGLKKPNMNGLWVAQDGEMLGINDGKFLWADASERYLEGYIKIENEYLLASVEGSERLMRFKYKLAGDRLLTMQTDGTIREFIRTSPGELYNGYYSGY